jgi:Secretion system C-terminal sorting domain
MMKESIMPKHHRLILFSILCALSATPAHAQRIAAVQSNVRSAGPHLNRIFSAGTSFGPLGAARKIASADNLLLFWSEPPSNSQQGTTPPDAYHFQIMSYLQGQQSVPAAQRLLANDSLVGDSVTDEATGTSYPAVNGSKRSVVLAGDMNNDANAEAVSVWETSNQEIFATAQPINKSNMSFQNTSVSGVLVGQVKALSSIYSGPICARLADLAGTGHEELVIAYEGAADGMVHIAVYAYSPTSPSHLALLTSKADMPFTTSQYYALMALTTGDLNQDGRDDIALAGFKSNGSAYIRFYDLDPGNTLVEKGERDFANYTNSGNFSPLQLVMSSGDFDGDGYGELALALNDQNDAEIYVARPDSALDSVSVSTDSSYVFYGVNSGAGISLSCGDLLASGRDQIVLGALNQVSVFAVQPNGSFMKPVYKSTAYVTGSSDASDYLYSDSYVKVGDVDADRKADISVLRGYYNDNGTTALQSFYLTVFGATDTNFTLSVKGSKSNFISEYTSDNPDFRRHYGLALCDINGALKLGQPTYFHVDSIVQPLVILNAPPVHFDIFNDSAYDICGVFNNGSNKGAFGATYNHSTTNTTMMETNVTSSWGIGASLSGEFSYIGAKVSASMDTHYGQDFSNVQNSSYQTTVSVNVNAQVQDEIYAIVNSYDLWEYPVLDSGVVKGHIVVTVPSPPQGEWFDTGSWTAYSFVPDHVVGNVLSYRTYSDSLENNPYLLEKVKGSFADGFGLGTANYSWSLSTQDFTSNQVDETKKFSLNVAADVQVGGEFGGFGASVKAGVSGDYSTSNLTSHTSSVTNALNLTVNLGSINQTLGEDQYTVTPYSYWARSGALVIDYAVQPSVSQPGGTETWWQEKYGHAPDPALALPYRYWPQEGFAVQDPTKIYQTKEIYSDPSSPVPGDTVTSTIRIHNYSLIPTDSSVEVSLYTGDPGAGGAIIKDINGDSVFSTAAFIPARGSGTVSVKWIAPSVLNGRFLYNGSYIHVWAVVDPQNKINEVHEDNNMGWSILNVPGIITSVEDNQGSGRLPTTAQLYQAYPNPFNPTTVIGYQLPSASRVTLKIYDVLGREVATLVSGQQNAGAYKVTFNGARYASGVYFYRLVAEGNNGTRFVSVKKVVLMK